MNIETGWIKSFWKDRGYGFIRGVDRRDIFCHISDIEGGFDPQPGQKVSYSIGHDQYGRPEAQIIRLMGE